MRTGRGVLVIALMALGAAGCTRIGDLGRPVAPPFAVLGFHSTGFGSFTNEDEALVGSTLTDDERELRTRAYHFLNTAGRGDEKYNYAAIRFQRRASNSSFWAQMISDIRDDDQLLPPLAEIAFRVARDDRERMRLADLAEGAVPGADKTVTARAQANRTAIAKIVDATDTRINAYAYAMDRGSIEAPDRLESEARLALRDLTDRSALMIEILGIYDSDAAPQLAAANGQRPPMPSSQPGYRSGASGIHIIEAPAMVTPANR